MSMSNYLVMGTIHRNEMKQRVPVGINHVTVVPENAERDSEHDVGGEGE